MDLATKDRKIAALKAAILLSLSELFSSLPPTLDTPFRKKMERLDKIERAR